MRWLVDDTVRGLVDVVRLGGAFRGGTRAGMLGVLSFVSSLSSSVITQLSFSSSSDMMLLLLLSLRLWNLGSGSTDSFALELVSSKRLTISCPFELAG